MDALLAQLSQPIKDAIAAVLRGTLDLSQEDRRLLANLLDGSSPCQHPNKTRSCNVCQRPAQPGCCYARDPAIRVTCADCLWSTLA